MKKAIVLTMLAIATITVIFSCGEQGSVSLTAGVTDKDSLVKRGEYLVAIGGCNDCHSPKKMTDHGPVSDPDLLLSGHPAQMPVSSFDAMTIKNWALFNVNNTAVVGPWGISFSANLTSDATGIGNWTEEQFKKALTQGKYKGLDGGRTLLPPMPWPNFIQMKDEDVKAIFAYLKSTKPVKNIVPAAVPPTQLEKYMLKK
jgi:mono/diheme cytochrome c family protein